MDFQLLTALDCCSRGMQVAGYKGTAWDTKRTDISSFPKCLFNIERGIVENIERRRPNLELILFNKIKFKKSVHAGAA